MLGEFMKAATRVEDIIHEINEVPEPYLEEVLDFILFIKMKSQSNKMETMLMSESSLKKDWLKPEEDEAWKDL